MNSLQAKLACKSFYEQDMARLIFGDNMHPGGEKITRELACKINLTKNDYVIDVGCGSGVSDILLAKEFGSRVLGIDLSMNNVMLARQRAREAIIKNVEFEVRDAEQMPKRKFTAAIAECSFSTFTNKKKIAASLFKNLGPGGRLGLSDIAIYDVDDEIMDAMFSRLCMKDTMGVDGYERLFTAAGFSNFDYEDYSEDLMMVIKKLEKLIAFANTIGMLEKYIEEDFSTIESVMGRVKDSIDEGNITYVIMTMRK